MLNTLHVKDKKAYKYELGENQDKMLSGFFSIREPRLLKTINFTEKKKRTRLVVKRGAENISMPLEKVVFFYTENKVLYAIDQDSKKYTAEGNLSRLQHELDSNVFFRANRQYLINISHIKSFRTYEKVKLKVDMNPAELNHQYFIIISQETAPAFRKWIYAA